MKLSDIIGRVDEEINSKVAKGDKLSFVEFKSISNRVQENFISRVMRHNKEGDLIEVEYRHSKGIIVMEIFRDGIKLKIK